LTSTIIDSDSMFNSSIRNLRLSSNLRSFTTAISMQSPTSSRRSNRRRHLTNRSQKSGLDLGFVADGERQMASMAAAVAPAVAPSPARKENRHFTNKKFADAPISLASKKAIQHE
jgi:hypothetical protein